MDIQGLRAIAVLAVVADHLITWPKGGFVGVDIFFVISGFLITGQLIRQAEGQGTVDFAKFYRARIRRILPAATVTIIATVAVGYFIFRSGRATSTLIDGFFAAIFGANWRFAATGTDYWASDGVTSPLQHFWSLSIEEQFYFVWPVVIVGVLLLVKARHRFLRVALGAVMAAIIVASFGWAMLETANNPTVAYFSTFSRAWELGVGALLAIAVPLMTSIPHSVRPFLAWAGLAGIVGSIFFITDTMAFPGPWAAAPVLATAAVIAAGTGGNVRFLAPLTNPVAVFVGNISYSLYLWHFPVIIFVEEFVSEWHWASYLLVFGLILLLSTLSYYFVEQTVLRSDWLLPDRTFHRVTRGRDPLMGRPAHLALLAGLAVSAVGAAATAVAVPAVPPAVAVYNQGLTAAPPAGTPVIDPASEVGKLQVGITAALSASTWPDLNPSLDDIASEGMPEENFMGCEKTVVEDNSSCRFDTGGDKDVVVFGDSTSIALIPTVRESMPDFNIRGLTRIGCIVIDIDVTFARQQDKDECHAFKQAAVNYINTTKPEYVFVSNTYGSMHTLASGVGAASAGPEWQAGVENLMDQLIPSGAKVVLVAPVPPGEDLTVCATRQSVPADCIREMVPGYSVGSAADKAGAESKGGLFLDTKLWYCTPNNECPAFSGNTLIRRDGHHVSAQYAKQLAPAFKEAFSNLDTP